MSDDVQCVDDDGLKNIVGGATLLDAYRGVPRDKALAKAYEFGKSGKNMGSWHTIGWDEYIVRWNKANPNEKPLTESEVLSYGMSNG